MSRSSSGFAFHPRSRFDAFLEGQLSASADQRVRAHLAQCPQCAKEVEQRSSALSVTRRLDRLSQKSRGEIPQYAVPVQSPGTMEDRGVDGWKFLVGAGVIGLVVLGVFVSLWILGGEGRSEEHTSELQS